MGVSKKNLDIEALRGFAIIVTVYAHLRLLFPWSPDWFEKSLKYLSPSVGVDLFFCISGYVITSSILSDKKNHAGFKGFAIPFWIRRVWRLWPSAWLWVSINLLCTYFINWGGSFGVPFNTVMSSVAALGHFANIYFPYCVSHDSCGSNMVNWSLSLEEQFYFIFPFLFFYIGRLRLALLLMLLIISQIFLYRPAASLLWSIRTDAICAGVILALYKDKICVIFDIAFRRISGVPYLLFILACTSIATIPVTKYGSTFGVATIVCFIFLAIAAGKNEIIPCGKLKDVFVYLGSRSYAIYLCHEVVFRLINEVYNRLNAQKYFGFENVLAFSLIGLFLTLMFSELNFRYVEIPLRNYGRDLANKYI